MEISITLLTQSSNHSCLSHEILSCNVGFICLFFFFFFKWLDKLGLAAQQGYKVVIRQSLFGGSYSLGSRDMEPNPVG